MSEPKKRKQRTWSQFGDVRKLPSEYEIVTHRAQWTLREGRHAALEQSPSSPANLWFQTYREGSELSVPTWDGFADPDAMIYRNYVTMQHEQETAVAAVLSEYSDEGHDSGFAPEWREALQLLFTTTRFPLHAAQMVQAYIGFMAPSPHIMNAAGSAAADVLRRVSLVSYRTRELELAWPGAGFSDGERQLWTEHPAWQPARELLERALVAYDWAEAFTAMNLVILPTLDHVLLTQLRAVSQAHGDELSWILLGNLLTDSERRANWSTELAAFALEHNPENQRVFDKWIGRWAPLADRAALALAGPLAAIGADSTAEQLAVEASAAREAILVRGGVIDGGDASETAEVAVAR
jgi:toluene monooxygenase system protein E